MSACQPREKERWGLAALLSIPAKPSLTWVPRGLGGISSASPTSLLSAVSQDKWVLVRWWQEQRGGDSGLLLPPLLKNQPPGSVGVASAHSPRAPLSLGVPQEARSCSLPCVPIVGSYTPDGSSLTPSTMGWITSSFSLVIYDHRPPRAEKDLG